VTELLQFENCQWNKLPESSVTEVCCRVTFRQCFQNRLDEWSTADVDYKSTVSQSHPLVTRLSLCISA